MRQGIQPLLPPLRQELVVLSGTATLQGAPTWLVHDPMQNRYFRISLEMFQLLTHWFRTDVASFAKICSAKLGRQVSEEEVAKLAEFIYRNSLSEKSVSGNYHDFLAQKEASRQSLLKLLIHRYLFFKIPIARPQVFLDICWPFVSPLFSRTAVFIYMATGLLGLYLVSRQWEVFTKTFVSFLTYEGLLLYGVSLVGLKIVHELGHAFMATKYGLKVPVIGIAFLVMIPILYTDTTDAWRLRSRRRRLMIDLAGVFTELAIAAICTLLWIFLPEGPAKSIAFTTATLSWVLSLLVNLNPFMRFDGYYVLADFLGIENLQDRGFAVGRWKLREILFGPGKLPPEAFAPSIRRLLTIYAFGTWCYRLMLFIGIALLVYSFFIKIIGIVLFVIEIFWFILFPVFRELKVWWNMRKEITGTGRSRLSLIVLCCALLVFFYPWSSRISAPAIAMQEGSIHLFAPANGRITRLEMRNGKRVEEDEVLAVITAPELEHDILTTQLKISLVDSRLRRIAADKHDLSIRQILLEEKKAETERLKGLKQRQSRLIIRAPGSGTVSNVHRDIGQGVWWNTDKPLATILTGRQVVVDALLPEADIARLIPDSDGIYYPDDAARRSFAVKMERVGEVGQKAVPDLAFADIYGGKVPTQADLKDEGEGEMKPIGGWYELKLRPDVAMSKEEISTFSTGTVVIEGKAESFALRAGRQILSVLIRESGI